VKAFLRFPIDIKKKLSHDYLCTIIYQIYSFGVAFRIPTWLILNLKNIFYETKCVMELFLVGMLSTKYMGCFCRSEIKDGHFYKAKF
jgi:hypothetical protein